MAESVQQPQHQHRGGTIARPPLLKVYLHQLALLLVVTLVIRIFSPAAALSVLLGGLIATGPNAWFARSVFHYTGARAAGYVTRSFYRGEAVKFMLTAGLFAAVFVLVKPVAVGWLFLAFAMMTVLNAFIMRHYLKY